MRIEKEPKPRHNIYLAGAWEKYCKVPYKTVIKGWFPELDIYDPEEHQEDWFENDLEAIRNSDCIICYANDIPMSACTFELGYFYSFLRQEEADEIRNRMIILIWEDIEPQYALEWHLKSGFVTDSVEGAIELYEDYVDN
jgi:hypothetical protein